MADKDEPTPDTREQEPRVLWNPMDGVAGRKTPLEEVAVIVSSASETACPKTREEDDKFGRRSHLGSVRLDKPLNRTQQDWASRGERRQEARTLSY